MRSLLQAHLKEDLSTAGTAYQSTGDSGSDFVIIFLFSSRILRAPGFADRFLFLKDGVFAAGTRDIITPELIEAVYGLPVTIAEVNGMPCVVPGDGTDHIYNHGP
jgi:ABC-type hemin transport system ATPase subunit